MTYYIDTYHPAKLWHKDSMLVLTWLKNKAHEKVKAKLIDEPAVIAEVLKMLAKEEYSDGKAYRVPNIFYLDAQLKTSLFMPRSMACSVINQILTEHSVTIDQAIRKLPAPEPEIKPIDTFDSFFLDLVKD
jgi:hypothetical protein